MSGESSTDGGGSEALARLRSLAAALSGAVTADEVCGAIFRHAREALGASATIIFRLSDARDEFILLGLHGYPEEVRRDWSRFPAAIHTPISQAVREERLVRVGSSEELQAQYPEAVRFPTELGHHPVLAMPLLLAGRPFGGIGLRFPPEVLPGPEESLYLLTFADICAQALERARLYDEQREARVRAEEEVERRRAAEDALRESEGRLRTLSDHLPLGAIYQVMETPGGGRQFLHASAGMELLFGVPVPEILADATSLYSLIHPDDTPKVAAAEEVALRTHAPYDCEFRTFSRSGEPHWVRCCSASRPGPGGTLVWDGIILDVTHQKQLEQERERFAFLVENSPDFIGISGLDQVPLYVNRAGLKLVGLESLEAARAVPVAEFFFPEDREWMVRDFLPQVLRKGHGEVEVRFRHFGTGEAIWMTYSVVALEDEGGHPVGLATISRNVTERKKVEASLQEADRRKDEFLATLAHELRNPLGGISNSLYLLDRVSSQEPRPRELRALARRQVAYLSRLVDDLLDVSRITRGLIELRREPVDLKAVVSRALESNRPALEGRQHQLTLSLAPEPVWVEGDAVRLEQVVTNLLSNAAKYTDRGGRIHVALERCDAEVVLRVRDSGIGIAPDVLPHIFELFAQAERTHGRTHGGLGIGLHLVRQLVALHGGRVSASSEGLDQGSEFVVRLPASAPPRETRLPSTRAPTADRTRRVLVVEDDRDAAETLQDILELAGHTVSLAGDCDSGLRQARELAPDLILCDIGLPGKDGYTFARAVRADPQLAGVRLIALTGFGQEEDRRRSREAGFDLHLTKPVDLDELQRLILQ